MRGYLTRLASVGIAASLIGFGMVRLLRDQTVRTEPPIHPALSEEVPIGPETIPNTPPPKSATPKLQRGARPAQQVAQNEVPTEQARPAIQEFPESLDAVPMTPWRQEQLAKLTAQQTEMLDHKLGLLNRVRKCLADQSVKNEKGELSVFLHYRIDPTTGEAQGSGVDLLDSSISRDADPEFLKCLEEAHIGSPMAWKDPPPAQGQFHWATTFAMPLEQDGAYDYFAH